MQRIYRRTSMHMCGFYKFEEQVWVFSCKFAAYLQDTILPFSPKTSGGLFLNILFFVKQKLFLRNYSISFMFAFQEHQKYIFKASRKAKMQINFWLLNFYRHASVLDITDVPTVNYSWADLLKQCQMMRCQGLD